MCSDRNGKKMQPDQIRDTWVSITVLSVLTFEATPCSCCEGRYYYQPKRRDKPGSWMGNKH